MPQPRASAETEPWPTLTPDGAGAAEGAHPRFFYGWVILPIAMAGVIASSPAQTFGVAPFNEHFRAALGLSETQLTAAYGLGTLLAALPMRYIGAAMDRYGIRLTKTVIIVIFGMVCMFTAMVNSLFTLFLAFFLLRFIGQGALGGLLSGTTLAFWFDRRLGTVEGLRQLGVAIAVGLVPGFNLWLIYSVGWRWAYVVQGLIVWAVMLPLMLLFRNRPEDIGQYKDGRPPEGGIMSGSDADTDTDLETGTGNADGSAGKSGSGAVGEPERDFTPAEARRTRALWLALLPFGAWGLMNTGVMFSAIPLFAERGVSASEAPFVFTFFAIGFAVMIVAGGYLADVMRLNILITMGAASMTLSWVVLRLMSEVNIPGLIYPVGIMLGLTQGLLVAAVVPLWPRYYGRKHLGKLKSMLVTVMIAASAAGPFLMGWTRDLTGSYDLALTLFAMVCAPMIFGAMFATPPKYPPRRRIPA